MYGKSTSFRTCKNTFVLFKSVLNRVSRPLVFPSKIRNQYMINLSEMPKRIGDLFSKKTEIMAVFAVQPHP